VLEDGVGRLAPIGYTVALGMVAARLMKSHRIHSTSCCTVAAAKMRQGSAVKDHPRHAVRTASSLVGVSVCVFFCCCRCVVSLIIIVIHQEGIDRYIEHIAESVGGRAEGWTELGIRRCSR
jgi:hypothetical protein